MAQQIAGPPIDSGRVFWFIDKHRYPSANVNGLYEIGFNSALDELERWLNAGGYERV